MKNDQELPVALFREGGHERTPANRLNRISHVLYNMPQALMNWLEACCFTRHQLSSPLG